MSATEIIKFCFTETPAYQCLRDDPKFDQIITNRFLSVHQLAQKGLLFNWREHPLDALAEVILLDQFSRNIFPNSPKAFRFDDLALVLAQEAIRKKYDAKLTIEQRNFLYDQPGLEESYHRELRQKEIINCFDRFPDRNMILNRKSTAEELVFLSNSNAHLPLTSRLSRRHSA